jgi:acyl-coenzyme A thioesterase PaaI-like protein
MPNTHVGIDASLCGSPVSQAPGTAVARLVPTAAMAVDDRSLVHGGFVFGLADYAAMLAVDDPNVVLGAAETRFTKPVVVGDELLATAVVELASGRKRTVRVVVTRAREDVMTGTFTCFVLDRHVLEKA